MNKDRIIVIGGGAAGLMAAGQAAEAGSSVLLLEKMTQPGRKICITGKGRCNLTNIADLHDFITHFGKNGRFLHQAFSRFFSTELMDFFTEIADFPMSEPIHETITALPGIIDPPTNLTPSSVR